MDYDFNMIMTGVVAGGMVLTLVMLWLGDRHAF